LAADEAVVLLQFVVAGFVALGLGRHASDFSLRRGNAFSSGAFKSGWQPFVC
jgi:hypothetical protein